MRCVVYVEGQSEMLFVADVLQKYLGYDGRALGLRCFNLFANSSKPVGHPLQGNEQSRFFYQIVNVNNDNRVISKLVKDIPGLISAGFDIILGLKDVYGEAYSELCKSHSIERKAIKRMYDIQSENLKKSTADVRLHFAIMEFEAWMLALIEGFLKSKGYDRNSFLKESGIDVYQDFENNIYHPASLLKDILSRFGAHYDKRESDMYSFLSLLSKDDYELLRNSGKSSSFTKFMTSLFGGPCPELP